MKTDNSMLAHCPASLSGLFQDIVLTLTAAGLCYWFYFLLAPWIWRQNMPFRPEDITPWILIWTREHDGIEIFALYILIFVTIGAVALLSWLTRRFEAKLGRIVITTLGAIASCFYCAEVGFIPPMNTIAKTTLLTALSGAIKVLPIVFCLVIFLSGLQRVSRRLSMAVVVLLLVPACFIATKPIAWADYCYVFAPALRLLNGAAPGDIYFQYGILPSLCAAVWMKVGLDLNTFQLLGQVAYYVAILGVFLLSRELFHKKELAFFLAVALVLGRLYASPCDPVLYFQVTPLRLDLWLLLLVAVYYRGIRHWSVGLVCGLLILLNRDFGIIYTLAYLQTLIALCAMDWFDSRGIKTIGRSLRDELKHCWPPLVLIAIFAIASYFLFKNNEFGNYSGYYQKLGIGFMQISPHSFYWYVPPLLSLVVILLFRMRATVSFRYLSVGLLLVCCAIGNSLYFFGRSHENNILNIAIILLFLLFFLLDLWAHVCDSCAQTALQSRRQHDSIAAAVLVLAVMVFCYSDTIIRKTGEQFHNACDGRFIYPHDFRENPMLGDLHSIRQVTNCSHKVYFVSALDFDCYYYGGYTQFGYCNPFYSWIFIKEMTLFLQRLLDSGYYLVFSLEMQDLVAKITYTDVSMINTTLVVSKNTVQAPEHGGQR